MAIVPLRSHVLRSAIVDIDGSPVEVLDAYSGGLSTVSIARVDYLLRYRDKARGSLPLDLLPQQIGPFCWLLLLTSHRLLGGYYRAQLRLRIRLCLHALALERSENILAVRVLRYK